MNKLFFILAASMLLASGCSDEYDDSALTGRVDNLESRVEKLEELCKQMNTNISSLQTLVTALQDNDYISAVTPVTNSGKTIGYTITFKKASPITIYHGTDGKDGQDGTDGTDGTNGKDGATPKIGVAKFEGVYYWTLNGEWLTDASGNKIKAEGTDGKDGQDGTDGVDGKPGEDGQDGKPGQDGKDGITPKLQIKDGYWWISYDDGANWERVGQATGDNGQDGKPGEDGQDGDSMFENIDYKTSSDYVIFTLTDGTQIQLPTWSAFKALEERCNQMNTNISSLQTIVTALQNNDYVKSVTPVIQDSKEIGYTLTFTKSDPITIYHGKDGQDGNDGTPGQDGITPVIGVKQENGIYYWTVDGDWLTDEEGNKIKAQGADGQTGDSGEDGQPGKDGITPQLRIEAGYWEISYDNGDSWTQLGKATGEDGAPGQDGKDGEDGKDGDPMFQNVDYKTSNDYVIFTLSDGTLIKLPTWSAFESLQVLCNQMNTNISALQTIVTALQDNDYVKSVSPVMQDGKEIGYTITFSKSSPITIYHGKNGLDGSDGTPGKDGNTPVIGVKQEDGIYYWTMDGNWLTDEKGNKIKAQGTDGQTGDSGEDGQPGKDGITPQLRIEAGYWEISYDNGDSWTRLGKATGNDGAPGQDGKPGEDGKDGDSMFQSITQDEYNVYFKLTEGETITLPKKLMLAISFSEGTSLQFDIDETKTVRYTITGGSTNNIVKAEMLNNDGSYTLHTSVISATSGTIEIKTNIPTTNRVVVSVSDGNHTIMAAIDVTIKPSFDGKTITV